MNHIPATLAIAVETCKQAAEPVKNAGGDLEAQFKAAAKEARGHFLLQGRDEDEFKAAIGGILLINDLETRLDIEAEMLILAALGSATSGVPVDWSALRPPERRVPLLKWWHETKP